MNRSTKLTIKQKLYQGAIWIKVVLFLAVSWFPVILHTQTASAAQLTTRSVAISSSKISATVTNNFTFSIGTTNTLGSMEFLYCTTAIGTCTAPTSMNVASAAISGNVTINGSNGSFSIGTNTSNKIQITHTAASATAGHVVVANFTGIVNPSVTGTVYVRITTYATASYTTTVDTGVVAEGITNQLTVNARVQEHLDFCVGTTTIDNATGSVATDCSGVTGNTVDIGTIDSGSVIYTPTSSNGGNGFNGVAMVRSNAVSGTVVSYFTELDTSSGALKVAGAACSGSATTDQCFNSVGTTQAAISASTEKFGMTIAGVNCGSTTSYTCTFSTGAYNLVRDANYDGGGSNTYQLTSGNGFAWDDSGTIDVIATSASSSTKVIDDEALILKFAATASITTPTGSYTVVSTYIATSTF